MSEGVSTVEALRKTLDAKATEHSTLQAIVTSVYDALEVGDSRSGSSLRGRIEALYTRVGERLKNALHIGMKRALAMVSLKAQVWFW